MTYQKLESKLATTPEQPLTDLTLEKTKNHEYIETIVTTKDKINHVKMELNQLIHSMDNNPSVLSRAARYWNEVPLWKKILGGFVFIVPLIVIGILANLALLVIFSIITGIIYVSSSILLDNHQSHSTNNVERLNTCISNLVDLLEAVISTIDLLGEQLAKQIEAFQKENACLTMTIEQFSEQIETLKLKLNEMTDTEKNLRVTQSEMEQAAQILNFSIEKQTELLNKTQKELEEVIRDNAAQDQLIDQIKELNDIKIKMSKELANARFVTRVLQGTVETLSKSAIQDNDQRAVFQTRLQEFLTNKEKSFDQIAERICEAERKLVTVTQQLDQSNQKYCELLAQQEREITRLEQIDVYHPKEIYEPSYVKPSINGFYGVKKEPCFLAERTHEVSIKAGV